MHHSRDDEAEHIRLLVVQRLPIVRDAVAGQLDREPSFTVASAGSLAEARGMLGGVDIAILDLRLPDGSGINLIRELRALNSGVKVIVHTASTDPAVGDRALRRGADAVLDQQAGLDDVIATVKRLRSPAERP